MTHDENSTTDAEQAAAEKWAPNVALMTAAGTSPATTPAQPADDNTAETTPRVFRNTHLSFSRLSRWEQCPLAFKLHYIDKEPSDWSVPLAFGTALHETFEELTNEVVAGKTPRRIDEEHAFVVWQRAWAWNGLTGVDLFAEGLDIVRGWIAEEGVIDPARILGVEQNIELTVGRFTIIGAIDRVNLLDDATVEIVDWKSNRAIFSRDEVEQSLQMSIYAMAAKVLFPWATTVKLVFRMVRHGIRLETSRTDEQLSVAARYVEMLGEQTETATEFPARLNTNCGYCDHRNHCPAYAAALKTRRDLIPLDRNDLDAVAREREQCAYVAKVAYARKSDLEKVLKTHLEESEELTLAGRRYSLVNYTTYEFPVKETVAKLAEATGASIAELRDKLTVIDTAALNEFLKAQNERTGKANVALLRLQLEAQAKAQHGQRFNAKDARG